MTNLFGEQDGSLWAILTDVVYKDGTIKAQIVPKDHPGAEEYKPMSHKLKVTPKYYMSIDGKVLSLIRKIPKIFKPTDKRAKNTEYYRASPNYFKPPSFGITVPKGFYDDYDYTKSKNKDGEAYGEVKIPTKYDELICIAENGTWCRWTREQLKDVKSGCTFGCKGGQVGTIRSDEPLLNFVK